MAERSVDKIQPVTQKINQVIMSTRKKFVSQGDFLKDMFVEHFLPQHLKSVMIEAYI